MGVHEKRHWSHGALCWLQTCKLPKLHLLMKFDMKSDLALAPHPKQEECMRTPRNRIKSVRRSAVVPVDWRTTGGEESPKWPYQPQISIATQRIGARHSVFPKPVNLVRHHASRRAPRHHCGSSLNEGNPSLVNDRIVDGCMKHRPDASARMQTGLNRLKRRKAR